MLAGFVWPGGRVADRLGSPRLTVIGMLVVAAGLVRPAVGGGRETGLIVALVMLGVSTGTFTPAGCAAIIVANPRESARLVGAVLSLTRGLSDAIGMVVSGSRRPGPRRAPAIADPKAAVGSPHFRSVAASRPPAPALSVYPSSWASTGAHAVRRPSEWVAGAVAGTHVPAKEGMDPMKTIDQVRDDGGWRDWALSQLEEEMVQAGRRNLLHVLPWPDPSLELDLVLVDPTGGPTGSLKDWMVRDLFYDAILRNRLRPGMLAVDATSGSTGIAEAYEARRLGLRGFIAVMPEHTTPAKQRAIRELGGECHLVTGSGTISEEAEGLALSLGAHYIGQFPNAPTTPDWHGENSLAAIADRQMRRLRYPVPRWTVVPAGTGRTLTLFALSAGANHRSTRICVADFPGSALCRAWPAGDRSATGEPSLIEGDARPQLEPGFDFGLIDDVVGVTDEDAFVTMSFLEELTGVRFGGTTGRVVRGALAKLLEMRNRGQQGSALAVGGDDYRRHLDTVYSADYRAQQGIDTRDAGERLHRLIASVNAGDLTGR